MKQRWLNRELTVGPYLTLVTSREQFNKILKDIEVYDSVKWIGDTAVATTTHLISREGKPCCIVSINPERFKAMDPIDAASVLVHEAVHVFQDHCTSIGEARPSPEFEAYSIQAISQQLMVAYRDTLK